MKGVAKNSTQQNGGTDDPREYLISILSFQSRNGRGPNEWGDQSLLLFRKSNQDE